MEIHILDKWIKKTYPVLLHTPTTDLTLNMEAFMDTPLVLRPNGSSCVRIPLGRLDEAPRPCFEALRDGGGMSAKGSSSSSGVTPNPLKGSSSTKMFEMDDIEHPLSRLFAVEIGENPVWEPAAGVYAILFEGVYAHLWLLLQLRA